MISMRTYRIGLLVLCVLCAVLTPFAVLGHVSPEFSNLALAAVVGWIIYGALMRQRRKQQPISQPK
ncbi:hypothetical protein AR689_11265 [Arthrobacter sp. EpRS71]|nr:hypothetical protein AR689_11265 [Arthrobacter sp. EpRS71]